MRAGLGWAFLAAVVLSAKPSDACSFPCPEDEAAASVAPANITAIPVTGGNPRLYRADDGGLVVSSTTMGLLVPAAPLEPNTDYLVKFDSNCGADGGTTSLFHADATAALPSQLGVVTVGAFEVGTFSTFTSCGSCFAPIQAAHGRISIDLPADLRPWADATRFMLVVDGQVFAGAAEGTNRGFFMTDLYGPTDAGHAAFTIFGRCERRGPSSSETEGLALGVHSAEVRALIAGNSTPLVSMPFTFTLSCGGGCVAGPDGCGGQVRVCDAGVPDAGVVDAGVPDAGAPDAGGRDAGALDAGEFIGEDGGSTLGPAAPRGCGCDSASASALLMLSALLLRRRR